MFFKKKPLITYPLRILLVTNALILIAGAMLGPIYALFVEDMGGDLMDASIAGTIFALVAGITTLLSGRYSDQIKESKEIVVLGYALIGIGFAAYIFVNNMYALFLVQALIGFGEALYSPAFDALYTRHVSKKNMGVLSGAWEAMNYFVQALGAIIGGLLVSYFGFDILFVVMSVLCLLSALYIACIKKRIL